MLHHVLRIEHPENGKGPFRWSDGTDAAYLIVVDACESNLTNWPPPINQDCDAFILAPKEFICGVEYFSQFYDWFEKRHLEELAKLGFRLYLHTLPKKKILFCDSGQQVAFRKSDVIETLEFDLA
jgi:hypothetical protein